MNWIKIVKEKRIGILIWLYYEYEVVVENEMLLLRSRRSNKSVMFGGAFQGEVVNEHSHVQLNIRIQPF